MAERAIADVMRTVRDQHISMILRSLLQSPKGRSQLTASTRIGFTTITRLVNALIDNGYVEEAKIDTSQRRTAGRPETPLQLRVDGGKAFVGTQIQGQVVTVDAFDLTGTRLATYERPHSNTSPPTVLRVATSLTKRVVNSVGMDRVLGVGVSTGGKVDLASGRLISNPRLGWSDVDLRGPFSRALGRSVVIDNSVRSLAAERLLWSPWAADSMLVVVVAGALSSALVVEGSLHRGASSTSGDIAHFPVSGRPAFACSCGARGCANSVLSDRALHAAAVRAGAIGSGEPWSRVFDSGPRRLRILRQERAERLGTMLAHLIALTDPALLVVAGRIGSAEDVEVMKSAARSLPGGRDNWSSDVHHWDVTEHEWGAGAAALAFDDFLSRPTAFDDALIN